MNYFDYFFKDREVVSQKFSDIFNELNNNVNKYYCGKPILSGEIKKYAELLLDKHISENGLMLSEVLDDFSELFQRSVIWEHPGTMINITPPANLVSVVASAYVSLYNPNFAQDESSGYLMATELIVAKYLSELVDWNYKKARGIFTFGGKSTNMYAVKIGLKKAIPDSIQNGVADKKVVVFSTEKAHPCHLEVCDWLGIGKKACEKIKVLENGMIDIDFLEERLRTSIENGKSIGCIIVNGGTTNELIIDPIKSIVELRDKLVKEYSLSYVPHIHVDSVIGWAWLFFKKYNFEHNPLNMSDNEREKIKSVKNKISEIKYADSFGADFHKTGFCPYVSSIFMARDFNDVTDLGNQKDKEVDNLSFGEYSPFEYTLELTRASSGPVSAYIAMELFGIKGFQKLLYSLFANCEYIREYLDNHNSFEVINKDTEGIATLFVVLPDNVKKYNDYILASEKIINDFVEYNYQFYLFCLYLLENDIVHFKITFSKSYKPFNCKYKTGALKVYPMSPIVEKNELKKYLDEIIFAKEKFDNSIQSLEDKRDVPIDYVYRD